MLWQNDNAVIVGKHQNTVEEINVPFVKSRGIKVVRAFIRRRSRVS
jgi:lipoate-protein ligase A